MAYDVAGGQILSQPVSSFLQGRALRQAEERNERQTRAIEAAEGREAEKFEMQKEDRKLEYDQITAKKAYAGAEQVLALPKGQRKDFVAKNFPELVQGLEQQGYGAWDEIDEDELEEMAVGIRAKSAASLGISPAKVEPLSEEGKIATDVKNKVLTPEQGDAALAGDEWTNPEPAIAGDREVMVRFHKRTGDAQIVQGVSPRPQKPLTQVNVSSKQETEEAKAIGKKLGEQYVEIQDAAVKAATRINRLDRLDSLLAGVKTGKLTPKLTEWAAYADAMGIKLDSNLDEKQAAEALIGEMTLQARNPSGGAGMPGAMSDADREFLKTLNPSLAQTEGGRKLVIDTQRKIAKRDQEVAKMARDYRKKYGSIEGFSEELAQWSVDNQLFSAESAAAGASKPQFIYTPGQGLRPAQ